ncbi:MAG: hypothetical protein NTX86_01065 [Candidatus Dependentiae bacterium]|nr:hypothetical protein [Candidatus Dependentiae bacterium]
MNRIPLSLFFLMANASSLLKAQELTLNPTSLSHYQALQPLLNHYQRPITFLELWPETGQLSCHVAKNYNSVCVMIDAKCAQNLLSACQKCNNVVLLKQNLSINDIHSLGECEHFDVTFVPDIANRFPTTWQKVINELMKLGDYLIIQAPAQGAPLCQAITDYIQKKRGEPLSDVCTNEQGILYVLNTPKKHIIKRRWNYEKTWELGEYTIESTFAKKKFIKHKKKPAGYTVTPWHPGINLYTFKQLNGAYPTKDMIRRKIQQFATMKHNDFRIFNLIIQGEKLVPIDCDENERHASIKEMLPILLQQFRHLLFIES